MKTSFLLKCVLGGGGGGVKEGGISFIDPRPYLSQHRSEGSTLEMLAAKFAASGV